MRVIKIRTLFPCQVCRAEDNNETIIINNQKDKITTSANIIEMHLCLNCRIILIHELME